MNIKLFTTALLLLLVGALLGWFANKWFNPIQYPINTKVIPYVLSEVNIKKPSTQIKINKTLSAQINESLNNNELNKASKLLILLIEKDPYDTKTLMLATKVYIKLGNYMLAFKAFEILYNQVQTLYKKQDIKIKIIHLAELYLAKNLTQHKPKERQKILQKLTSLLPEVVKFHYQLGMLLVDIGNYNDADYQLSYLRLNNSWQKEYKILTMAILRGRQFANGAIEIPLIHTPIGWILDAQINNKSVQLLLDTGANITTISDDVISIDDIKKQKYSLIKLYTANGTNKAYKIQVENFSIATISYEQFPIAVVVGNKLPPDIDGLLGTDWLSNFDFVIDQEKPSLILKLLKKL